MTPSRGVGEHTRREFLKLLGYSIGALAVPTLLSACSSSNHRASTLLAARDRGFIRVGIADEAPYGYIDDTGRVSGEAPAVAAAVMTLLGVGRIEAIRTPFGALIPDLLAGHFDVIAAGMFITPERCEQILFSEPTFCVEQAFLVPRGNPNGILRYTDIAQNPTTVLGVLTGAVEGDQAAAAGVSTSQLRRFDSPEQLLSALVKRQVDAGALTTISLEALSQRTDLGNLEVTKGFTVDGVPGCGAFGFRKEDAELRDAFDQGLRELRRSGELASIVAPHGFSSAFEASATVKMDDLCTP